MNALFLVRQNFKDLFFKDKKVEEVKYKKIIPHFLVILDNINSLELTDSILDIIKYDIVNNLKYSQLDNLIGSIHDKDKKKIIENLIFEEEYRWYQKKEVEIFDKIDNSRLEHNTADFISFIIGEIVELQRLTKSCLFNNVYIRISNNLFDKFIPPKVLSYYETEQNVNVSINSAYSFFFRYEKNIALNKFKNAVRHNIQNRNLDSFEAEYFEVNRIFFDRLKLEFIPIINLKNKKLNLTYDSEKHVTKKEILEILDYTDFFNQRNIVHDLKKILNKKNIKSIDLFEDSLYIFFEELSNEVTKKDIKIFISVLMEAYPSYDLIDIKNVQIKLNRVLGDEFNRNKFKAFFFYLNFNLFNKAANKLKYLLSNFFNKIEGMSESSLNDVFYSRFDINTDFAVPDSVRLNVNKFLNPEK